MRYSIRESQSKLISCLEENQSSRALIKDTDEKNSDQTQQFNDPKLLGEELGTITTILEKLVVF